MFETLDSRRSVASTVRYGGYDSISDRLFNLIFASTCAYGMVVFAALAAIFTPIALANETPLQGVRTALDWVGVLLFSAYTIYDFNQAKEGPRTVEAAMSSGISVFLDLANLFIRLLSLFGSKNDD